MRLAFEPRERFVDLAGKQSHVTQKRVAVGVQRGIGERPEAREGLERLLCLVRSVGTDAVGHHPDERALFPRVRALAPALISVSRTASASRFERTPPRRR